MRPSVDPEPNLRVCVVVPARDEEDLVGRCLQALADQHLVSPSEYEVLLILDDCTDSTEDRALEVAATNPDLRLRLLDGPGEGAGHARRTGMEAAYARLRSVDRGKGLIASTDADTVVAPDWLATQLECVDRGARAIGGRIELADDGDLPNGVTGWRAERGHQRHMDLLSESAPDGERPRFLEHWQFSGASLALTAEVYREIGGLEPHAALEDEHLERILRQRNVPIERPLSVRVTTSARLVGRAQYGLARDLSLATWFRTNTYEADSFDTGSLLARKKHPVSAVLAANEDSRALRRTVEMLLRYENSGLLDEVLVVCAGPPVHGLPPEVTVRRAGGLMPDFGPVRGYGDILWRAVSAAEGETLIFLEPGSGATSIPALIGPLIEHGELALVKGFCSQPDNNPELVARPLINLHRPELAGFVEPLFKSFAARRSLLETLPFPVGEGASLSLLLDAAEKFGVNALAQAGLGRDNTGGTATPSPEVAYAVQAAAASRLGGQNPVAGPLFLPSAEGLQTRRVPLEERPPLAGLSLPTPVSRIVS
ncbi:MAG: glycosyltransferase family 2 protein [Rubrobacteraceae bacterium]